MSAAARLIADSPSPAEKLGSEISELAAYITVATYQLLLMIAEFDRKRYWEAQGFPTCAHWLAFNCGFGMNSARERLRVAHALFRLPKIAAKFSKGQLSYSKVRAVTRVADETNEEHLLNFAEHGTAAQVERLVAQYRQAQHLNNEDNAYQAYINREVSYYYDLDGSVVMKVRMPAEQGEMVLKALEKMMDRDYRESEEPAPAAARRADALSHITESWLSSDEESGSKADRYQVVVHVRDDSSEIENGARVSAETSRRIACDCPTVTIVEDGAGEPLSVGRKTRRISDAIRRALVARDGGCRFPGCLNARFVKCHHIEHWADGGQTSLDNLVLLCDHHHHLVHEGGFDCRRSESGEVYFMDKRDQLVSTHVVPRPLTIDNALASMRVRFSRAGVSADHVPLGQTARGNSNPAARVDWRLVDLAKSADNRS